MSSDIDVKITKDISAQDLLAASEIATQEILSLSERPILKIEKMEAGVRGAISGNLIGCDALLLLGLTNGQDEISVIFHEIKAHPSLTNDIIGCWATTSVDITRTPISFALAAGTAIAIARHSGATIIDEGLLWNHVYEQSPAEFVRKVKVKTRFIDIYQAAQEFYNSLPLY